VLTAALVVGALLASLAVVRVVAGVRSRPIEVVRGTAIARERLHVNRTEEAGPLVALIGPTSDGALEVSG